MAIKVEAQKYQNSSWNYPAILIDEETGLVVLITSHQTGTVLRPGTTHYEIGYYGTNWKMNKLARFHGSLKMENA